MSRVYSDVLSAPNDALKNLGCFLGSLLFEFNRVVALL